MDSGGYPENCQTLVKMTKIDHFGEPSENCKTCSREPHICENNVKILSQNNMVAASGRCQKGGGGFRPPLLIWSIFCPNIMHTLFWDKILTFLLQLWDVMSLPGTMFWQFPQGPSKCSMYVSFWHFFDNYLGTLRNPSKLSFWYCFDNFQWIWGLIDRAGVRAPQRKRQNH